MRSKALAAGMAALTFGGAVATAALPSAAEARGYGYYGGHRHHGNDAAAAAIVAGVAGLAVGAALANNHRGYYGGYGYAPSYYGSGYGYAPSYYGGGYAPGYYGNGYAPGYYGSGSYGYATCASRHWAWDPYIGRRVLITTNYAC